MLNKIKGYVEPNKKVRRIEIVILCALVLGSIFSFIQGFGKVHENFGDIQYVSTVEMTRDIDEEDYDEDSTVCDVTYRNGDAYLVKTYTYEEYEKLDQNTITAYEYETENHTTLYFDHENPTESEVSAKYQEMTVNDTMHVFNLGTSLFILSLSLIIRIEYLRKYLANIVA